MWRILKWLFYLVVLAAIGLTAYAYLGPILGSDFSPRQDEVVKPVTLGGE